MIAYYFLFLAAIGLVFGVLFLISRVKLRKNGVVVTGIVEKLQKRTWRQSGSGGYANLLVISYIHPNGYKKNFTEQNSIPSFFYKEGDKIDLLLDVKNNNKIMVKSDAVLFSAPLMVIALSLVAGYVGYSSL